MVCSIYLKMNRLLLYKIYEKSFKIHLQLLRLSGIYLHIPYCKKRCVYCNFHFILSQKNKKSLLQAMVMEIEKQKNYLNGEKIKTIYFGGGTPSLLSKKDINILLNKIYKVFNVSEKAEVTLEANPEDLDLKKIKELKDCSINRISLGVQSFKDRDLRYMNRIHSANQSLLCVKNLKNFGFVNISIDLIFGLPNQSNSDWEFNLMRAFELDIQHFSAYCLTVEPNTLLAKQVKENPYYLPIENQVIDQFTLLMDISKEYSFEQYEISNYAKKGFKSKHNTNYWKRKPYLGIGPSAHSFNGESRQWNIKNNTSYIKKILANRKVFEIENLSKKEHYNEYVLTGLRMNSGIDKLKFQNIFGVSVYNYFTKKLSFWIERGMVLENSIGYKLSKKGKLQADGIASDLFLI